MHVTRLRQVVVAAADLEATTAALRGAFGLGEPYADRGVSEFGLANGVIAVGDQFLEVVSPIRPDTAAGRWMARAGGDAGYMVIVQVEEIVDARRHLADCGLRTVWSGDFREISGTHVHPADIGGAIVSFDEPRPAESWHWAGPNWGANVQADTVRGIAGITMASPDADALAASWGRALSLPVSSDRQLVLPDATTITFVPSDGRDGRDGRVGLVGIDLVGSAGSAGVGLAHEIAGTTFTVSK